MADSGEARDWPRTSHPTSHHTRAAAAEQRRFRRKAMRIGDSDTVHGVRLRPGADGALYPAPACRIGTDTPDAGQDRKPVSDEPITCKRCWQYAVAHEDGLPYQPRRSQIGLWPVGEERPELPSWPPTEPEKPPPPGA